MVAAVGFEPTPLTRLDANSGFWQTPLSEESRHLTTFITPWGSFMFNVLPYGISSGSEKFQKNMNMILEGLDGVECSIDDVPIHGKTQGEHDTRLQTVLERVRDAGMTLNLSKCEFSKPEVKFLGHVISARGIEADPEKVKAIADLPSPNNVSKRKPLRHLSLIAYQRNERLRAEFRRRISQFEPHQLLFIDESSKDERTFQVETK
ncbi:Retrovirus-related Pol polyprotein from transposon 297 [Exaiptasia diaphana]|nr:Retrovirus-related Pol polyprotein from transposon 297 [Exaiptasia diaphana]